MFLRFSKILLIVISILIAVGCSKADSPITSAVTSQVSGFDSMPIVVTDCTSDGEISSGMGALGLFELNLDPSNMKAELVSLRASALKDVLEVVDITNFLQMAPCTDCAKIKSVSLDIDGNFVVTIGIKHPFGVGDPYKPITGRNRADLHVFNVEGTIVSNSNGISFPAIGKSVAGFKLLNADGYTSYLDSPLDEIYPTTASIHPYKLHFDDYSAGNYSALSSMGFESVTTPPPSGNLVMAMGCDYDYQDYVFDMDNGIDMIFAVGCTYAVSSASKSMRFTPEYRVPQHNKKAACEVGVEIVSNGLRGEDTSSSAQLEIHVIDINHDVAVGDALNEMLADSSVSGIAVEIPGVTSGATIVPTSPISGTGHSDSDPLVYQATIVNGAGGVEGSYLGIVKVTDSYGAGLNTSPLLNGMDGIKRVDPLANPLTGIFAINEFATYQIFNIDVATGIPFEVYSIIPNQGDIDSGDISVSISGSGFDPNAQAKLVKNDNPSIELQGMNEIVNGGGTDLDCQFNLDSASGAAVGVYHVVVTNPGPPSQNAQLNDGFEIIVFSGCVETYRDEIYAGTRLNYNWVYGCAFTQDGLLITPVNSGGYHLYGFDVTQNGDISGTPIVNNALYANNTLGDIDVCDVTGNIVYAICGGSYTGGLLNTFVVYSPSGVFIGEYKSENTEHLQGVDTDDDGSIWVVGHSYIDGAAGNYNPNQYYLNNYTWDDVNSKYVYNPAKSANITATQKYVAYANIYDIAVSFADDRVLVYTSGSGRGRIDAYDFSSGAPTHLYYVQNILPENMGTHAHYNWRAAADIEIDHTDLAHEYCRVLISSRNYWTVGQSFSKLDTDGNVIDWWLNANADAEDRFFWSHAINTLKTDPDGVYMVATEDYSSFGGNPARYHVFKMPAGW